MRNREESFAQTNRRIVEAAIALHAERGVLDTSWQDIAERASVSPVTVYRHFRSPRQLIPACARSFVDSVEPMTESEALAAFGDLKSPREKLAKLIREDCACYERGREWFRAATRERDLIPELDEVVTEAETTLAILIRAALEGTNPSAELLGALRALIDFPFWWSLVEAGVSVEAAPRVVLDLSLGLLARYGVGEEGRGDQGPDRR
jgi:AcrR family transcriptional regulator